LSKSREQRLEYDRERSKERYYKDPKGWYKKREFYNWRYLLDKKFGITAEYYMEMLNEQNNVCAICCEPEKSFYKNRRKRLAVDHCHKTGNIRGLLCTKCNTALGQFDDNLSLFLSAIEYLLYYEELIE